MKLKVTMHTGETYEISVDEVDMAQINEQRNSNELSAILIGNYSLSRINIRDVVPMEEEEVPEEPQEEQPEEPVEEQPEEETPKEPVEEPEEPTEESPEELENNS